MGGLSFLAPWFLFALGATAIPVVIHLLLRHRARRVAFSSLRLIRPTEVKAVRTIRLQEILLLILRALLLAGLALAFAKPLLRSSGLPLNLRGRTAAILVLDNSFSMGYEQGGRSRLHLAQKSARELLSSLASSDRAAVIMANNIAQPVTRRFTSDLSQIRREIENADLSSRATDLFPAVEAAHKMLASADDPNREIYVFTDLQAQGLKELLASPKLKQLVREIKIILVNCGAQRAANLSVVGVEVPQGVALAGSPAQLTTTIRNFGREPARSSVGLMVNGELAETQTVSVAAGGSASCEFRPVLRGSQNHQLEVVVEGDDLPADDRYHLCLESLENAPILCVAQGARPAADSPAFFLSLALNPPGAEASALRPAILSPSGLADENLSEYRVVILSDVGGLSVQGLARLQDFVQAGGGLLAFLGRQTQPSSYHSVLATGGLFPGKLTGSLGSAREHGRYFTLTNLDYSHPTFSSFSGPRSGGLSSVRFYQIQSLSLEQGGSGEGGSAVQVLARYNNGLPAVLERSYGAGKVILITSGIEALSSDFPLRVAYLPWLHRTVSYLAAGVNQAQQFTVGEPAIIPVRLADLDARCTVLDPERHTHSLSVSVEGTKAGVVYRSPELPGIYRLTLDRAGRQQKRIFVANLDPEESDLSPISDQDLRKLSQRAPQITVCTPDRLSSVALGGRRGVELWRKLLFLALVVALAECLLAEHLARLGRGITKRPKNHETSVRV